MKTRYIRSCASALRCIINQHVSLLMVAEDSPVLAGPRSGRVPSDQRAVHVRGR